MFPVSLFKCAGMSRFIEIYQISKDFLGIIMKKNDQKFSIQKSDLLFIGLFVLLITFRLWLITGIPKMLVYGPHDDLYFAKAAF